MANEYPQVMTIAGSDSDGSAGMQADMNTFFAREVYGISVLTACVAGNSYGIHAAQPLTTDFIDAEFKAIADDFHVLASKTGMLTDKQTIETVTKNYKQYHFGPLILDPVIITKHGAMLLEADAYETLKTLLVPLATVITPNFFELQKLADMEIHTDADMITAAKKIQAMGAKNVVAKGAHHIGGDLKEVKDLLLLESGEKVWLSEPYHDTEHINGTGDALSACITAEIAKGQSITVAVTTAKKLVNQAIEHELAVGHKYGPINIWQMRV
ncbi:bifunctional hydroxymethylpyrimidine kinase/phosphomethylpyrimidine kinase [Agrilactobacillus fermenti]|uniref:bifunctional hydroxymethylpyrimidine kinase/phosphomethylpyrimidine kinase n=1 Tax=Agrilactobacillus fermenti TaxID=2586909 RepID=UPI001E2EC914|nr:bifunctional hydroxymethylpyrimidine kinase/phosphomethylpyrimidine kinase [Agrilactobacillus fermenti]MCD2256967.1 bifunctional hydroxymethylpyrimidine kinase/phosphomethylpyrimidine kinase [Agrilactobacillus fermenti]